MDSNAEESLKKRPKKNPFSADSSRKIHFPFRDSSPSLFGSLCVQLYRLPSNFMQEEDIRLETTRARFANVVKRHEVLAERLSSYFNGDSDKMIFEHLQKEFEAAWASQTRELYVDGAEWNDGLSATLRQGSYGS